MGELRVGPGYMTTQAQIIGSDRVAQRVVKLLRLDQNPTVQQQWRDETGGQGSLEVWLGGLLKKALQVLPSRDSNIISVSYTVTDTGFAAAIANAFAQVYIDTNIELRVDPARQYSRWFGDQGKSMRENLENAQSRLSEFQQQKGIVAKDERVDVETAKLNDLSAQLTVVQAQTSDFESKQKSGEATLPDVMGNPLVAALTSDIARLETKLQEGAGILGKNHPSYQRMETELAGLKKQLEIETQRVTKSFASSTAVGRNRESELRAAIAAQKKKLLELRNERDQLAVLQRDVDAAQSAWDTVSKRYTQTSLESQVTQTNVSVLSPAVQPLEHSSPNIPKYMLISLFLGILLAGGAAFGLELLDRRIRSVDDLTQMLEVPVLAVIRRPRPKRQNRLVFWWRNRALALR